MTADRELDPETLHAQVVRHILWAFLWSPQVADADYLEIGGTDSEGLWGLLGKWRG